MRKSEAYSDDTYKSGMICSVYRNAEFGDTSNNGVSNRFNSFTVLGPEVATIFEPAEHRPTLYLHHWELQGGKRDYFVSPSPDPYAHFMFGGNFVYSCDSRWPTKSPIRIHDRVE